MPVQSSRAKIPCPYCPHCTEMETGPVENLVTVAGQLVSAEVGEKPSLIALISFVLFDMKV